MSEPAGTARTAATTETIGFPVEGMTCGSCANRITRTLGKLPGISAVRVDLRHETATVSREPALVSNAALAAAVEAAGYRADLAAAVAVPAAEARTWLNRLLGR